jgi:hypothetical protein
MKPTPTLALVNLTMVESSLVKPLEDLHFYEPFLHGLSDMQLSFSFLFKNKN